MKLDYTAEGEILSLEIIEKYNLSQYDINSNNESSFIGVVFSNHNVLFSFPKHYLNKGFLPTINSNNDLNIKQNGKLLFDVLMKYYSKNFNKKAENYYGFKDKYDSSYPFRSFFSIYEYYLKYGIYTIQDVNYSKSALGRINWKKTFNKSSLIISEDGNGIYVDPYRKNITRHEDFLSNCMIYAINKTIDIFNFLIPLKRVNKNTNINDDFDKKKICKELMNLKNKVFNDKNRLLLDDLIEFFSCFTVGGSYYFKIRDFDDFWENMVNEYLNKYFIDMNEFNDELIWSSVILKQGLDFEKKRIVVDGAKGRYIEPDHFASNNNKHYIFDSKYYYEMNQIDYKQLSYQFLLSNFFSLHEDDYSCMSALFLPGNKEQSLNYDIKDEYSANKKLKTIQYYLDVYSVMYRYIYS